ncbi:MAG: Nif11-like leader peptide family RiPP precursor [Synergistaceae bacterium]|jgi:predicted ribosomally synthesized peptide with nif11-like leader|nr:Nif11-like leader peptide family RiPP precursor [Synergistaceae bacterium]
MALGAKELAEKLKEDKAFAEKYAKLRSLDAVLEQAKADGYSVSKDEALSYISKAKGGELSEEDLAAVAGGSSKNENPSTMPDTLKIGLACIFDLLK